MSVWRELGTELWPNILRLFPSQLGHVVLALPRARVGPAQEVEEAVEANDCGYACSGSDSLVDKSVSPGTLTYDAFTRKVDASSCKIYRILTVGAQDWVSHFGSSIGGPLGRTMTTGTG